MTYARRTKVPAKRTRDEIERTVERYGADSFLSGWEHSDHVDEEGNRRSRALVQFRYRERLIRFLLPLPAEGELSAARHEQEVRARWRGLLLIIKAKLEAVESGIAVIDEEFLAQIVMPDGRTVGEVISPRIELVYSSGGATGLLPEKT